MRLPREPRLWMMKQVKENERGSEGTADGREGYDVDHVRWLS